jgi:hypothetical protein
MLILETAALVYGSRMEETVPSMLKGSRTDLIAVIPYRVNRSII